MREPVKKLFQNPAVKSQEERIGIARHAYWFDRFRFSLRFPWLLVGSISACNPAEGKAFC